MKKIGRPPPNRRRRGFSPTIYRTESVRRLASNHSSGGRNISFFPRGVLHTFSLFFDRDNLPRITDQQLPLAGLMGLDKRAASSLPSDEHSKLHFKANDTECRLVSFDFY